MTLAVPPGIAAAQFTCTQLHPARHLHLIGIGTLARQGQPGRSGGKKGPQQPPQSGTGGRGRPLSDRRS